MESIQWDCDVININHGTEDVIITDQTKIFCYEWKPSDSKFGSCTIGLAYSINVF